MTEELARKRRSEPAGIETIDWLWVEGKAGVVSTWFSPLTKDVIGYSVCDGAVVHSIAPNERAYERRACEFLGGDECSFWRAYNWIISVRLRGDPVVVAYDAGDLEFVYRWLEATYGEELA